MATPKWLQILETVGLVALQQSPLAPIAPAVQDAIAEAESIKGASSAEKLNHVVNIAVHAASAARISGVAINPIEVQAAARGVISDVVKITNIASGTKQHADNPPTIPVPVPVPAVVAPADPASGD